VLGALDLASQSVFAGRYRVVRRIAAGGMGAVFEVVHVETQRRRALKIMLPELLANQHLRERFQMEARITANVETEYIVDVFDAGIDEASGIPFLVMELLNGEDLAKLLERGGPLTSEQVVTYLRQVASALEKTHAAGIVHRDLKPENLFLTHREDGTPRLKILDFGISKVVHEATTGASATKGIGTPLYMAPEQVLAKGVSASTDLYALGLIAYTLLVGVPYWQSDADRFDNPISFVVHTSKGITDSASIRASQVGHSLPAAFDAWFLQATHLDPGRRFRSAGELVSALATALGVALPAHPGTPVLLASASPGVRPSAAANVETMVARTAPGTELDRPGTLSGASPRRKAMLFLGLGVLAAGVAGAALLGGSHARVGASAEPSDTAQPASPVSSASGATEALAPVPASSASASASAAPDPVKVEPTLSASADPSATSKAKTPTKVASPRPHPVTVHVPRPPPRYTRD